MAECIRINERTWRIEDGMVRFYLFCGNERAALIDTGMTCPDAKKIAQGLTGLPLILINTHADPDHISGNAAFGECYMSPAEEPGYRAHGGTGRVLPVKEGDVIGLGGRELLVIDLPGHTPGSIALLDKTARVLVAGDSVQDGNIFMFGPRRDLAQYVRSLRRLQSFLTEFDEVYPMHGSFPVRPELIDDLISGAEEILEGRVTGMPTDFRGGVIRVCKFPFACFLCDP